MDVDKRVAVRIAGEALGIGALGWLFGWGWGTAIALAAFVLVAEAMRARNSSGVRRRHLLRHGRLPNEYSLAFRAHAESAVVLWGVEIASLGFVAAGICILVSNPEKWLVALAAIGFFGLGAAVTTYMLVLRRRGRGPAAAD